MMGSVCCNILIVLVAQEKTKAPSERIAVIFAADIHQQAYFWLVGRPVCWNKLGQCCPVPVGGDQDKYTVYWVKYGIFYETGVELIMILFRKQVMDPLRQKGEYVWIAPI